MAKHARPVRPAVPTPVEAPVPDAPPEGPSLSYMPALDGVRAFAVLGVMAFHSGVRFLPAGFLGVDTFFVLSGFLITSLLLGEWAKSAGIGLRRFWARRARRLLPALLVVIVFVVVYAALRGASGHLSRAARGTRSARSSTRPTGTSSRWAATTSSRPGRSPC